ncbi:unnamed protein product [Trichogramma brassicae]|uniref:Uncharacterized protein n=1 Tax=Trichogramma brassicae TaxID=86971 RepID=A0A6H5I3Y5_9HYME|nr:unnamed protein product [Trichogramma brassicae]
MSHLGRAAVVCGRLDKRAAAAASRGCTRVAAAGDRIESELEGRSGAGSETTSFFVDLETGHGRSGGPARTSRAANGWQLYVSESCRGAFNPLRRAHAVRRAGRDRGTGPYRVSLDASNNRSHDANITCRHRRNALYIPSRAEKLSLYLSMILSTHAWNASNGRSRARSREDWRTIREQRVVCAHKNRVARSGISRAALPRRFWAWIVHQEPSKSSRIDDRTPVGGSVSAYKHDTRSWRIFETRGSAPEQKRVWSGRTNKRTAIFILDIIHRRDWMAFRTRATLSPTHESRYLARVKKEERVAQTVTARGLNVAAGKLKSRAQARGSACCCKCLGTTSIITHCHWENRKLQSRGLLDESIESTSTLSTITTITTSEDSERRKKESLQKLEGRWVDSSQVRALLRTLARAVQLRRRARMIYRCTRGATNRPIIERSFACARRECSRTLRRRKS